MDKLKILAFLLLSVLSLSTYYPFIIDWNKTAWKNGHFKLGWRTDHNELIRTGTQKPLTRDKPLTWHRLLDPNRCPPSLGQLSSGSCPSLSMSFSLQLSGRGRLVITHAFWHRLNRHKDNAGMRKLQRWRRQKQTWPKDSVTPFVPVCVCGWVACINVSPYCLPGPVDMLCVHGLVMQAAQISMWARQAPTHTALPLVSITFPSVLIQASLLLIFIVADGFHCPVTTPAATSAAFSWGKSIQIAHYPHYLFQRYMTQPCVLTYFIINCITMLLSSLFDVRVGGTCFIFD